MAARTLACDWSDPWRLLAKFYCNSNRLPAPAAPQKCRRPQNAGADFSENAIQSTEMWSLWEETRTFFIENWDKWQEIEIPDDCAEKSIEKIPQQKPGDDESRD